jgi:hypothetical protein
MNKKYSNRKLGVVLIGLVSIALIALASLPAVAQTSAPKPVVPQFTVRYVEQQYDVPPTTTVDPYTGETVITHLGYSAVSRFIEIKITNEYPYYDQFNDRLYKVRYKGHFENDTQWKTYHSPNDGGVSLGFIGQEKGDYTIISVKFDDFPKRGEIDFQVESALGGIEYQPHGLIWSDYIAFNGEESDWSPTQTVSISENAAPSYPAATGWAPQNPIAGQPTWGVNIVLDFDWDKIVWVGTTGAAVVLAAVLIAVWRIKKSNK